MSETRVVPGDILGAKYRVEKVLGAGGMGVVVAATHIGLEQHVAVKYMLPGAFRDPDLLARFQREARAAVKLRSEHVARVLDTGTFDDGSPYIVMEYLEGNDLAAELRRGGALPVAIVAEYILHVCDAVAEAHSLGMVHRDLKPANLFLTRRHDGSPLVKVLDFGISKTTALDDASLAMTSTASMLGSPLYMSPEQMRSSKHVDARTDVWSLGVILYELLSGHVPFTATTLGELLSQVMMDAHRPLTALRADVPPDISALVERCLVKDRNFRASSVADIAVALAPYVPPRALPIVERVANVSGVRSHSVAPAAAPFAAASAPPAVTNTARTWGGTQAPTAVRGSRVGWAIFGIVTMLSAAAAAAIVLTHREPAVPSEARSAAAAVHPPPAPTLASSEPVVASVASVEPAASAPPSASAMAAPAAPVAPKVVKVAPVASPVTVKPTVPTPTHAPRGDAGKTDILGTSF